MDKVTEFYKGKTLFVTGATGFLGGVLLEKILRCCPGVKKVYLVVRPRKGLSPSERLREMFTLPIYSLLTAADVNKVEAIEGDVTQPRLGLSPDNLSKISKEVNIVFHVAALLNFSASLDKAVRNNLEGTAHTIELSKSMANIQSFVYVSTAYCNSTLRDVIAEEIYPNRWNPRDVIQLVNTLSPDQLAQRAPEILGGQPNTYSFTKQLSENLINNERGHVPVSIVRPTIVLGTVSSPIPGWVDNVNNGIFAFIAGLGRGIFRTLVGDESKVADIVPVDLLASLVIVSAWKAKVHNGLKVYHFTSGKDNPITWGEYCNYSVSAVRKHPCMTMVMYPRAKLRPSNIRNSICMFLVQYLPACFLDLFTKMIHSPYNVGEIQMKYVKGIGYTEYFTFSEWIFDNRNTRSLSEELKGIKKEFQFDLAGLDWKSYIETCVIGVRTFFHGESAESLPWARALLHCWRAADIIFHVVLFLIVGLILSLLFGPSIGITAAVLFILFFIWL